MDLSKFKTSDWLKVGGAALMLICGFLTWNTAKLEGFGEDNANGFEFFFTGTIPWILVVGTGVVTFLLTAGVMKAGKLPWGLILLAATGLASLLVLIRVLFNPIEDKDVLEALGGEISRGIGMFGAVIGTLAATAGAFMGFKDAGGSLSDLTDMDKMKGSFGGGSTPPPPPPPAG